MTRRQRGEAQVARTGAALRELAIEYVQHEDVIPNTYNPNRQNEHEYRLLKMSMVEDGFTQPVIVGADGYIVDGEHRWRASKDLRDGTHGLDYEATGGRKITSGEPVDGFSRIPIVRVPMDAAQARVATLRHNRARGSEDVELSVQVLRDLETLGALDWAAESLDLSDAELQRLLEDIPAPEALAGLEFTEAWQPGETTETESTALATTSTTAAAADAIRARQEALSTARTEEERQAITRDRAIYRVSLTFTGEQGAIVKEVLGEAPAEKLVELCRAEQARTVPTEETS